MKSIFTRSLGLAICFIVTGLHIQPVFAEKSEHDIRRATEVYSRDIDLMYRIKSDKIDEISSLAKDPGYLTVRILVEAKDNLNNKIGQLMPASGAEEKALVRAQLAAIYTWTLNEIYTRHPELTPVEVIYRLEKIQKLLEKAPPTTQPTKTSMNSSPSIEGSAEAFAGGERLEREDGRGAVCLFNEGNC